jgi:glycine/D-amino acid oxidase-like deaminating enzyme
MSRIAHLASYYAATATYASDFPGLEGELDCDCCVIGGGYTGLSAALELAGRGHDVVLLKARRIGWGASGRNGGQIVTGYSADHTRRRPARCTFRAGRPRAVPGSWRRRGQARARRRGVCPSFALFGTVPPGSDIAEASTAHFTYS